MNKENETMSRIKGWIEVTIGKNLELVTTDNNITKILINTSAIDYVDFHMVKQETRIWSLANDGGCWVVKETYEEVKEKISNSVDLF